MARRKSSINIDSEIESQIRQLQAELIAKTKINWTYSSVLSIILENGLKDFNLKNKDSDHKRIKNL
jgi:hypothetical protein